MYSMFHLAVRLYHHLLSLKWGMVSVIIIINNNNNNNNNCSVFSYFEPVTHNTCDGCHWKDSNSTVAESKLSGHSGGGLGKGRRACTTWLEFEFHRPPIPLWLPVDWAVRFPWISKKQKIMSKDVNKHWKTSSSPPISISNRLFRCRYSNSRDAVK